MPRIFHSSGGDFSRRPFKHHPVAATLVAVLRSLTQWRRLQSPTIQASPSGGDFSRRFFKPHPVAATSVADPQAPSSISDATMRYTPAVSSGSTLTRTDTCTLSARLTLFAASEGTVSTGADFAGGVARATGGSLGTATDAREASRIGIFGTSNSYGGSYGRVTNEALGRDLNPLGRGGGEALVAGMLNVGTIAPEIPKAVLGGGSQGNSVNNPCPRGGCGGGGGTSGFDIVRLGSATPMVDPPTWRPPGKKGHGRWGGPGQPPDNWWLINCDHCCDMALQGGGGRIGVVDNPYGLDGRCCFSGVVILMCMNCCCDICDPVVSAGGPVSPGGGGPARPAEINQFRGFPFAVDPDTCASLTTGPASDDCADQAQFWACFAAYSMMAVGPVSNSVVQCLLSYWGDCEQNGGWTSDDWSTAFLCCVQAALGKQIITDGPGGLSDMCDALKTAGAPLPWWCYWDPVAAVNELDKRCAEL